jgi:predicted Zn-ribbon and HTH transcriptional regulator
MTCINCGMGFIITPINLQGECPHCGYINSPLVLEEDNMIKKIWEKLKSWICFWK